MGWSGGVVLEIGLVEASPMALKVMDIVET